MTGKPFGDNLGDGDTRDIASHAEETESECCYEYLCLDMFGNQPKHGKPYVDFFKGGNHGDG